MDILISFAAAVGFGLMAVYVVIAFRHNPTWSAGALFLCACAEMAITYALHRSSSDQATRIFWYKMFQIGFIILPTAFLCLALRFSGLGYKLTNRTRLLLSIFPMLTGILILTNELHGWMWNPANTATLVNLGGFPTAREVGIWYWVNITYNYLVLGVSCFFLVRLLTKLPRFYKFQTGVVIVALVLAILGTILDIFRLSPLPPLIATLVGLGLGSGLVAFIFVPLRRRGLSAVTHETVLNSISDALIFLDVDKRIIDLNRTAEILLDRPKLQAISTALEQLLPPLAPYLTRRDDTNSEVMLKQGEAKKFFDLRISGISGPEGQNVGQVVILHDITEHKHSEVEQQALLEIMQVVTATESLQELFKLIHQSLAKVIDAENFFVVFHNKRSNLFEEVFSVDKYDAPMPPSKLDKSITAYVFRSGEALLVNQVKLDELVARGEVELVGTNSSSWLGAPLKTPNETIGVIAVQNYEDPDCYSEFDRKFLASVATQVSLVIERKQALEDLQASREAEKNFAERLTILSETTTELSKADSIDSLCRGAVELGRERLGFDRLSIFFLSEDSASILGTYGVDAEGRITDERADRYPIRPEDDYLPVIQSYVPWVRLTDAPLALQGQTVGQGMHVYSGLWNGETMIGYLTVDNLLRKLPINDRDCEIICLYATAVGHLFSLQRAQEKIRASNESEKNFAERLTVLSETTTDLSKIDNIDELCRRTVELGRERLDFDRLSIFFLSEDGASILGTFGVDAEGRITDERADQHPVGIEPNIRSILQSQIPLLRLTGVPLALKGQDIGQGTHVFAGLWDGSTAIGYLTVDNLLRQRLISEHDCEIIRLYATAVGHLISLKRTGMELEASRAAEHRFAERLTILSETTTELSKIEDLGSLCRRAVELGRERLDFDRLSIWFLAEDRTTMSGTFGVNTDGQIVDERNEQISIDPYFPIWPLVQGQVPVLRLPDTPLSLNGQVVGQGMHFSAGLWDGNTVIGYLGIDNLLRQRPFGDNDCELIRLYASAVGHLISLNRAQSELHIRNEELTRLYRASGSLISGVSLSFRDQASKIIEVIHNEFGQANCSLLIVPKDSDELVDVITSGLYADQMNFKKLTVNGPGLIPLAIRTKAAVNVGDVHSAPEYVQGWEATQSELVIPLKVGEDVIGVVDIQSSELNAFNQDDERLMTIFAERAALLLEHSRLNMQTEVRLKQLTALHTIDTSISGSLDIRLTMNILLDETITNLSADASAVLLFLPVTHTLEYLASHGFRAHTVNGISIHLDSTVAGQAVLSRQLQSISGKQGAPLGREKQGPSFDIYDGEEFITHHAVPLISKDRVQGVLEVFHRSQFQPDNEWFTFLNMLAGQAAIAIENNRLFLDLQRSNIDIIQAYNATIQGWSQALDLRDKETEGHALRVTDLSHRLAQAIGVPNADLEHIQRGALLHDIGKMGIPDYILLKTGKLTEEEWDLMRLHSVYAFNLLSPITYLKTALDIPHYHHEKWDGTGYPDHLKGEQIPLYARLFSIVDVYDALTSDRPYRLAWAEEKVLAYIREQSGKHFDPKVVDAFLVMMRRGK